MEATFFIDESGNTGTDWLNNDQPFFTYGGWLIPNQKREMVETFLYDYISMEQASELKSKYVFRRTGGLELFSNIYNRLIYEFSAVPFFKVVDKKFMVAAKMVETFFDCEYNPFVNAYLTHPVELKKALANCIYNYENKKVLNSFSTLIKNGTHSTDAMKIINQELILLCRYITTNFAAI